MLAISAIITYLVLFSYSTGSRVGTVVKLSKKGLIWKTYEGTLQLGNQGSNVWQFSVRDEAVVAKLQQVMEKQRRVRLDYEEANFNVSPMDTLYTIKDVTIVD